MLTRSPCPAQRLLGRAIGALTVRYVVTQRFYYYVSAVLHSVPLPTASTLRCSKSSSAALVTSRPQPTGSRTHRETQPAQPPLLRRNPSISLFTTAAQSPSPAIRPFAALSREPRSEDPSAAASRSTQDHGARHEGWVPPRRIRKARRASTHNPSPATGPEHSQPTMGCRQPM
jgi:hypothetical protein